MPKKPSGARIAAAGNPIDIGLGAKDRAAIADGLSPLLEQTAWMPRSLLEE